MADSVPKSNPWKKARQLGSTLSGLIKYLSYNAEKNEVCAAFKKEYLSMKKYLCVFNVLPTNFYQKYNNSHS